MVLRGKRSVSKATTKSIWEAWLCRTHTEVHFFLGIGSFYRLFDPTFPKLRAPFNEMLKKGTLSKFDDLTDEQYEIYQNHNYHLVSPLILTLLKTNKAYSVDTDASVSKCGWAAHQQHELQYKGKMFLAIVWSVFYLLPSWEETRSTMRTNEPSFSCLLNMMDASSRVVRGRLRQAKFSYIP